MPQIRDDFQEYWGSANIGYRQAHYFNRPDHIITLHPYTITNVNCTPAIAHVGGRSCVSLAGAGAGTDGSNFCYGTAAHRFVANKLSRLTFSVRSAAMSNHSIWMGYAVVSTTLTANLDGGTPGTDYFGLNKVSGTTNWKLRTRKASGTEETTTLTLPATAANDTWYDWDLLIRPSSTAGAGTCRIFLRTGGGASVKIADITIATQLPDTVSTALSFGMLAGTANTSVCLVAKQCVEQEW